MVEDLNSEEKEVTPQESETVAVETNEAPEENQPVEESHDSEDKQDRNWREIRRKQRESDIKIQTQNELIEKLLKSQQTSVTPQAQEPDEFANIAPEDYPTWGQTDKRIEKKAEAIAERKYQELEAKKQQSRFMERLQSKYDDFSDVVNPDSIAILEQKQPELALTIADLKDPYKMGLQTYHYLKAMNVSGDVSEKRHAKEVEKKLEKNEKTVQSPQAFNKRPMAQAFKTTEAELSKLYEEMMGYASHAGSGY